MAVILFDFDDTLSEQTPFLLQYAHAIARTLAEKHGGEVDRWSECAVAMMQTLEADYIARFRDDPLNGYCAWLREMRRRASELLFTGMGAPLPADPAETALRTLKTALSQCEALFPGAREAVQQLHQYGYSLHMASGNDSDHLHAALCGAGIEPYFDRLFGPDRIDCAKEGPEFFARICTSLGVSPDRVLVVDNDPNAIGWAAKAGVRGIQVDLLPSKRVGRAPEATALVTDLSELPNRIVEVIQKI